MDVSNTGVQCDLSVGHAGPQYCEAFNGKKHHQMCESSRFVESTNALTRERKEFMLIYHVLDTKKACERDREETLQGD